MTSSYVANFWAIVRCVVSRARLATSRSALGVRYGRHASCMSTSIHSRGSFLSEANRQTIFDLKYPENKGQH